MWCPITHLPQFFLVSDWYYFALKSFRNPKHNTVYNVYLYLYLFLKIFHHPEPNYASYKQTLQASGDKQALIVYIFFLGLELSDLLMDIFLSHRYLSKLPLKVRSTPMNWAIWMKLPHFDWQNWWNWICKSGILIS